MKNLLLSKIENFAKKRKKLILLITIDFIVKNY